MYDIIPLYREGDQQDLLVNNERVGSALAAHFSAAYPASSTEKKEHDHNVVLMANHGFTTLGTSVTQAVYRAVYTHMNAGIQSQALAIKSASQNAQSGKALNPKAERGEWGLDDMRFLDTAELKDGCVKMNDASQHRPWEMWVREVEVNPLYRMDMLWTGSWGKEVEGWDDGDGGEELREHANVM